MLREKYPNESSSLNLSIKKILFPCIVASDKIQQIKLLVKKGEFGCALISNLTDLVGMIHFFWQSELSLGQPGSLSNLKRKKLHSVSASYCIYGTQLVAPYGRTIQMASAPVWSNIASTWGKLSFLRVWQHRKYMVRKYLKRKFMVQIISSALPSVMLKYLLEKIQQTVKIFSKWW